MLNSYTRSAQLRDGTPRSGSSPATWRDACVLQTFQGPQLHDGDIIIITNYYYYYYLTGALGEMPLK